MSLQRLLFEHNAKSTQETFAMAIQNQDLAIMKLLIEKAQKDEPAPMNNLVHGLFDPQSSGNHFIQTIFAQDTKVVQFLKSVYEEETGQEFPKIYQTTFKDETHQTIESNDAKALYQLQLLDSDLDLNMMFNSSLNLTKNVELMIWNNKKHFNKEQKLKAILEKLFEFKNYSSASTLFNEYPELMKLAEVENLKDESFAMVSGILKMFPDRIGGPDLNQDLAQALQDSNIALINSYIDNFPVLSSNPVALNMWKYALQHSQIQVIYHILDKIPELKKTDDFFINHIVENDLRINCQIADDYEVLQQISINTISFLLKHFPEKFGGTYFERNLVCALDESNLQLISSYIDNFRILSQEGVSENLWKYVLQNSNISTIYQVLNKNQHLKNSDDHLIKFLLSTDLRSSHISSRHINTKEDTYPYHTQLHLAAEAGSPEIVKLLLVHGADITATDEMKFNALHIAAEKKDTWQKSKASIKRPKHRNLFEHSSINIKVNVISFCFTG